MMKLKILLSLAITIMLFSKINTQCPASVTNTLISSSVAIVFAGESNNQVDNFYAIHYNCYEIWSQDNPLSYRTIGITVNYTLINDDTLRYIRFGFECTANVWTFSGNFQHIPPTNLVNIIPFTNDSYITYHCAECFQSTLVDYGCKTVCDAACPDPGVNNSAGYCYGATANDCCPYIHNIECRDICPGYSVPNANGVCICDLPRMGTECEICSQVCVNGAQNSDCSGCDCATNWEGATCNMCPFSNLCVNGVNNTDCTGCDCIGVWEGALCDMCPFNNTCVNGANNTDCTGCDCIGVWEGTLCDMCPFSDSCVNGVNNTDCTGCNCLGGWEGALCDTCPFNNTCVNGANNTDCTGCVCIGGWQGALCDMCPFNDTCVNGVYNSDCTGCDCIGGWEGTNCNTCPLSGMCVNGNPNSDCSGCNCNGDWIGLLCDSCNFLCLNGTPNSICDGCDCFGNWTGISCDFCYLNEPSSPSCMLPGVQNSSCQCDCGKHFEGDYCETNRNACIGNPCIFGECVDLVNYPDYSCNCYPGYLYSVISKQCEDIDECDSNPCDINHSTGCNNEVNTFTCNCKTDYTGQTCNTKIDDCTPNPCLHGVCTDGLENFTCACNPGYTGFTCSDNINECQEIPPLCQNGAVCMDNVGSYACICTNHYRGQDCEICDVNCLNSGIRTQNCTCECTREYNGSLCDNKIPLCELSVCPANSTCIGNTTDYYCICPAGYTGVNCEILIPTPCQPSPCMNGGQCVVMGDQESCDCSNTGFTDDYCLTEVDDCSPDPCVNGDCTDKHKGYTCSCNVGYTGINCDEPTNCIPACDYIPQICVQADPGVYLCECREGFHTLPNGECQDIDECFGQICQADFGVCINTPGSYRCECIDGYKGDGISCENIDECKLHFPTCDGRPTSCQDEIDDTYFSCSCKPGFDQITSVNFSKVPYCDNDICFSKECTDINECLSSSTRDPCTANQLCYNTKGNLYCECLSDTPIADGNDCISQFYSTSPLCSAESDSLGVNWPSATPGTTVTRACPNTEFGITTRRCIPSCSCAKDLPRWSFTDASQCTSDFMYNSLGIANKLLVQANPLESELLSLISNLNTSLLSTSLYGEDLRAGTSVLFIITTLIANWESSSLTLNRVSINYLLNLTDNLLQASALSWQEAGDIKSNQLNILLSLKNISREISKYLYTSNEPIFEFDGESIHLTILQWNEYQRLYEANSSRFDYPSNSEHMISIPFIRSSSLNNTNIPICQLSFGVIQISDFSRLLTVGQSTDIRENSCLDIYTQLSSTYQKYNGDLFTFDIYPGSALCSLAPQLTFTESEPILIYFPNNLNINTSDFGVKLIKYFVDDTNLTDQQCDIISNRIISCYNTGSHISYLTTDNSFPVIPTPHRILLIILRVVLSLSLCLCLLAFFLIILRIIILHSGIVYVRLNVIFTISTSMLLFLVGIDRNEVTLVCAIFTFLLYYFALCSVLWAVLDVANMIVVLFYHKHHKVWLLICTLVGYLLPLLPSVFTIVFSTCSYIRYKKVYCWISSDTNPYVIWSMASLLYLMVLIASILFVIVVILLIWARDRFREMDNKLLVRQVAIMCSSIFIPYLVFIQWILATYAFKFDESSEQFELQIAFVVVSGLIGPYILIVYTLLAIERFTRPVCLNQTTEEVTFINISASSTTSQKRGTFNPVFSDDNEHLRASKSYETYNIQETMDGSRLTQVGIAEQVQSELENLDNFLKEKESTSRRNTKK